jgi:hypothetical protein
MCTGCIRAADWTFYRERRAKGEQRGLSRVQAAGHARDAGERSPGRFFSERRSRVTGFFEPGEAVSVRVSRREMQRVVAHHHLIDRLDRARSPQTSFGVACADGSRSRIVVS